MIAARAGRYRRQRGFALLIVLWALVLLALITAEIGAAGRTETRIARNLVENGQAEAAADGAVFATAFRLMDPVRPWPADGRARPVEVGGITVAVAVQDEAGKVDPNSVPADLLQALLVAVGAGGDSGAMAQAIVDWRGGQGARPPEQLADAYRAAGLPYVPPGAPFTRVDEVGLVLGMTPKLFAALEPHLTLAHPGLPDPKKADPVVKSVLAHRATPPASGQSKFALHAVAITARAAGPGAAVFTRRAVVQYGSGPSLKRGYAILAWDAPRD